MAGIFIWHEEHDYNPVTINDVYESLDYKKGDFLNYGEWNVLVFPKTGYQIKNYFVQPDGIICGTGTFAYKGKVYEKALPLIYKDAIDNNLDLKKFWGSFLIFLCYNDKACIIRDGAMISHLYGLRDKAVYSNSFAGLMRSSDSKLHFNKDAATELLSTGVLTSDATLANEIEFIVHRNSIGKLYCLYSGVDPLPEVNTRNEAIKQQLDITGTFIKRVSEDWFSYMPESHFNVSITAGLDSRLLTGLILQHHKKFDFYTYWRDENINDPDFKIARQIAEYLEIPLRSRKTIPSSQLNDSELERLFTSAHNICDGIIRPGSFWDEEFSTADYRISLSDLPYLRVTGFEGEYYRNMEHLPLKSHRSYKSWVRWDMIYRFAGNNFTTKESQLKTESRIVSNLVELLGPGQLDLLTYKNYYLKVVVPSYRSLQSNVENRFGFILNPFANANIAFAAIQAYKYLGKSFQFEIDMLKALNPGLAGLPNDYGFNFLKGPDIKSKISIVLWEAMAPSIKHRLFSLYRNNYASSYINFLTDKSKFIESLIKIMESVQLEIDLNTLIKRNIRGKLVLNMGFFLKNNEKWIIW